MKTYNVAVLGATGAVGREMLKVLEERNFPVGELRLLASARSVGKKITFRGEEIAVAEANETAKRRGDTNNVGKFEAKIIVHMPELVKVKPKKQHEDGNNYLNSIEQVISNSDSILEAGLLAMAMCENGK